jgi:hypothetical protein
MSKKTEKPAAAKPPKDAPKPKPAPKQKVQPRHRVPLLLETAFSMTKLALLLAGPLVLGLSLQAGVGLPMAALRAGAALFVLGLLAWGANWVLARSALDAMHAQLAEAAAAPPSTTVELEA